MAKLTSVSINIRRWTNSVDPVVETLITECLPKHYGWEAAQKAYYYAQRILKKRWPAGEKVILDNSPKFAYLYARNIIKGRWKKAEPFIATCEYSSYYYAKYVLKGRFPYFEKQLEEKNFRLNRYMHEHQIVNYAIHFLKKRLPGYVERKICERAEPAAAYAENILRRRWKAAEKYIVKSHVRTIDRYVRSLRSVKDRRDFRTLLLAEAMSADNRYWCPAKNWIEKNEENPNPVLFN